MIMAMLVLTLLGLGLGLMLALAARFLAVKEDNPLADTIEAMMPGSQCGQCGFPGCRPAAEAMVSGEADVTCCPPGGRPLAEKIAGLLDIDLSTLGEAKAPLLASINEALCTGCTRCYRACPTDAIVGANKQLHTVIPAACTGCSKCEEACPEDCIDLNPEPISLDNWFWHKPQET